MKYHLMILFGLAGLLASCSKDKEEEPAPVETCNYDAAQLKYTGFIKEIIDTKCAISGCHVGGGNGNGDFTTYAGIFQKVSNGTFNQRVLIEKSMPQGFVLSECDYKKLKDWFNAGAPN